MHFLKQQKKSSGRTNNPFFSLFSAINQLLKRTVASGERVFFDLGMIDFSYFFSLNENKLKVNFKSEQER